MSNESQSAQADAPASPQGPKWRRLALLLGGGAVALTGIRLTSAEIFGGNANRFLATEICSLIVGMLFCAWLIRDSGLRSRVRYGILALLFVGLAAFLSVFRIERITFGGDMQQRLPPYRRWVVELQRRLGADVVEIVPEARTAASALDLSSTEFDSPSFFGPTHDGHFQLPAGKKLARDWATKPPKELWRVPVGPAWSSFAVVGHYGFTQQQTSDEAFEQVACFDLHTGKHEWVHSDAPGHYWQLGGYGPRATPTFHQGKLFTLGSNGLLSSFDAATGKVLWSHDVLKENQAEAPMWGKSSSPTIVNTKTHGDVVVVSVGGNAGHSLIAYRADTGQVAWHAGDDPAGYATPMVATLGGVRQVVIVNFQSVTAHDPETGTQLWKYDGWDQGQPKVPQPIVVDDRHVFVSAGYGVGCRLLEVTKDGDAWKVDEKYKSTKFKPKFMNPVLRGEYVYGLDDGEFLMCIAWKDGAVKWRSKRGMNYGHGQLLLVDDLLVVQCEEGDVALAEAKPDGFNELGRFTALPTGVSWNQPVLWGTKLLVRNDEEAACYELATE